MLSSRKDGGRRNLLKQNHPVLTEKYRLTCIYVTNVEIITFPMATAEVAISSSKLSSFPGAINVNGLVPKATCNTLYHVLQSQCLH